MNYRVNEIFLSIQGEGVWSGHPMCFIRLAGCNLKCPWCDTDHEPKLSASELEIVKMVDALVSGTMVGVVCLTGGEPTTYDLDPLVQRLRGRYQVHIETNGTRELRPTETPEWITVSPKWPPGLGEVQQQRGSELKVPISPSLADDLITRAAVFGDFPFRFLQPVDGPDLKENAQRCKRLAIEEGTWRLSFQGHKRLGLK